MDTQYEQSVIKMQDAETDLLLVLSETDVQVGAIALLLARVVYLAETSHFDRSCVLNKIRWRLRGVPDTTMKKSALNWLRRNLA